MKLNNSNALVTAEIEKALGQTVRLRVSGPVTFVYCGMLSRMACAEFTYMVCAGPQHPEILFTLDAVRAIHYGPTQDMLAIHIS